MELGRFYGITHGSRIVAMAGERFAAGNLREISSVCTHPDFRGQGLATQLVAYLVRLQLNLGEIPFLQVMSSNDNARRVYERMGFVHAQELVVRVVSRR
jgi:predicted GNAT family acetyltransferase